MSDDGERGASSQPKKEEGGRINTNFIKSPVGIVLLINFVSEQSGKEIENGILREKYDD